MACCLPLRGFRQTCSLSDLAKCVELVNLVRIDPRHVVVYELGREERCESSDHHVLPTCHLRVPSTLRVHYKNSDAPATPCEDEGLRVDPDTICARVARATSPGKARWRDRLF